MEYQDSYIIIKRQSCQIFILLIMRINIISKEKQIYEECKENGQWQKSIEFKLPIIEKEFTLSLDNDTQNETVCLLSKLHEEKHHMNVRLQTATVP